MRITLLLILLLANIIGVQAQEKKPNPNNIGTITGKITDSASHSGLEYVTVSLFVQGKLKPIDGATTNHAGHFQLSNIAPDSYKIVFEFIGYKPLTIDSILVNKKNSVIDLKNIPLSKKIESLQPVVITAQGKIIENKIDKMVFNAEKDLTSQTGVAADVLKKIPQVSVDADGNVELAGSSSIRFLINGKPSSAFGSSTADVLQSIPASQIKSVEIITNPGAKYDAQGLGGIINIILKKNTAKGVNGNLSLSAGTRMHNGSFNFNARKGKFAFNAFASGNLRPYFNAANTYDRTSTDSSGKIVLLHQEGINSFKRSSYQTGIGFDYTINDKNSLTGSFGYSNYNFPGMNFINQSQITKDQSGTVLSALSSVNNTSSSFIFGNTDISLSYKKTFIKEDQELNVAFITSFGPENGSSNNLQYYMPQDSLFYGTKSTNPGHEKEKELQIDYTQPLKKDVLLGIGGKLNFRDISSSADVLRYQPSSKTFLPDIYLTNSLGYHQKVYAFYSELTFPVAKLFNAKMGARYERTEINSFFSNAQSPVKIPGYNTFVPSIFFSKDVGENQTFKLSYSKRIERPDYRDLNPFINTSDSKNITAGNPFLQPEIGNRFEFGYTRMLNNNLGSVMINVFYRTSGHDIQPYIVYYPSLKVGDSIYTNVSVSTRQNVGLERDAGINLFNDLHFFTKLNLRFNFFVFRRHTLNVIDPGLNASSINFRMNMNASYDFTNTLSAEFFGNFNSARHQLQGIYPSFTSYSFGIRKQFWKKNGSIAFTSVNPFNEYLNQQTILHGSNFDVTSVRKIPFRSFAINFTWKFGKLELKKNKEENNVNLNPPIE